MTEDAMIGWHHQLNGHAAAKSLPSCPSLCDPIVGRPPDSSVPGFSVKIMEWVAISFSINGHEFG